MLERNKVMTKQIIHSCKIGTVPRLVILRYNYKIEIGKKIIYRDWQHGSQWHRAIIDRVNSNGYFFAALL